MQFTTAFIASFAAISASALPQAVGTGPIPDGTRFGLITINSGSPIQNGGVQAARKSLLVNAKNQNATCDTPTNFATFYIEDEVLYLHSTDAPYQTAFTDRSWFGQGIVGYTTGAEPIGTRSETKGWALSVNNELQFQGQGFQACSGSIDGGWSLWLTGVDAPGGNTDCISVAATAIKADNPISCLYTQE
jgi:hypothetical protein